MGFGEKQIGGKQQEREQNNYTPTKPIEPESDERLLVKAADEGKDIEWPMAIVQKTRTEPKLTFSCKPDAYASFAALIKTQRVDEPAVVSEKQSSEDMELSDEETEEKSNQQPLGPKLPPAMVAPPPRTVVITGVKQPKISIGYPTISYPSIHAEKPVAVETQIVEKSATIELKKFGPVEPPPIAHKMVKSNFQPVTSAAMSISIEKPTIKDDSLNVVPAEFGGRSKAQMDAELERLRLEALASMENAKNVLAQVAKLSGKPQEDLTGVFMSPRKGQLSEKTSTSEEEEEEEGTKQKSKAKSKRDKKRLKQRKEKLSTKGKRKKQVEEDSGDEEMLEESSEDSSSESESEEETPPKRKTKKNRKQKKRTGKKHKAKGKSTKGKKKKMSESDEDENSSEEDSSESDESDVKQKKKKKKAIKDKRRRKHEETSESEESSEELARPSKKKRRQDHPEAVASAKEVLQDDEVPSMDEDEVEKKKTKGKKKGKAKRERSMSAEVKKKKRNKREPSSSSSDEEDKPIAKHRRNRPSESAGETAKSSKRASDSQQPTSQQNQSGTQRGSGDTHKDAECLVDEKAEQKRKSRWGVNADGQIKEPSDPANLPKPNIAHVLSLGKDGVSTQY